MSDFCIILTTVADGAAATALAEALVGRRLAACVNISSPVQSIYRWQGVVEHAEERMLFIKIPRANFEQVRDAIVELHPYDLPEIVAVPIEAGSAAYLAWIAAATTG